MSLSSRLRIAFAPAFLLAVGVALCGDRVSAAEIPKEAAAAIAAHEATIDKIETAHVKSVSRYRATADVPFEPMAEDEWWKSGERNRFAQTVYRSLDMSEPSETPKWIESDPPQRDETGYDDREVRSLEGWNSDDVPTEPIHPVGKYHTAFYRISASIGERDPERPVFGSLSLRLLLSPYPGDRLKSFAESAEEVRVTTSEEEITLDLLGVKRHGNSIDMTVGLDPRHGHLICRVQSFFAGQSKEPVSILRIAKFADLGDGVFLPVEATVSQGDVVVMETSVTGHTINEPMDADLATVRFPEGCRVYRFIPGAKTLDQSYLWGKGEPQRTFATNAEYEAWHIGVLSGGKRE